jgi:hypothetical protein
LLRSFMASTYLKVELHIWAAMSPQLTNITKSKKTPFSLHLFLQSVSLCVPFLSTQGLGSREIFLRACFAYNTPSPSHPISACNDVCTLCCPTTRLWHFFITFFFVCSGGDCLWVGSWDLRKRDKFISAHM